MWFASSKLAENNRFAENCNYKRKLQKLSLKIDLLLKVKVDIQNKFENQFYLFLPHDVVSVRKELKIFSIFIFFAHMQEISGII